MTPKTIFPEIAPGFEYVPQEIAGNIWENDKYAFPFPRLEDASKKTAAIIGGGPTLKDILQGGLTRLQSLDQQTDCLKVVTGSAHRLLDEGQLKNGAHIAVINSQSPLFADVVKTPQETTAYWLAGFASKAVVDKLSRTGQISMWDAYVPEIDYDGRDGPVIGSGSTAPSAAAALLVHLGVKDLKFYGVDGGSFAPAINNYDIYDLKDVLAQIPQPVLDEHVIVEIGGKPMKVAINFWNQAEEMAFLIKANPDVSFMFEGESLNNMLFNQGLSHKIMHDPRATVQTAQTTGGQFKINGPA